MLEITKLIECSFCLWCRLQTRAEAILEVLHNLRAIPVGVSENEVIHISLKHHPDGQDVVFGGNLPVFGICQCGP